MTIMIIVGNKEIFFWYENPKEAAELNGIAVFVIQVLKFDDRDHFQFPLIHSLYNTCKYLLCKDFTF